MPARIDWFQAPQVGNWMETALQDALEGYKAGRVPAQMRAEEEKQQLMNQLLGHQSQHAADVNRFYPQEQGQKIETERLNLEALPQDISTRQWLEMSNAQKAQVEADYIEREKKAKLTRDWAEAEKAQRGPEPKAYQPSKIYKHLVEAGYTPGTEEFNKQHKILAGIHEERNIPPNTRDLKKQSVNERLDAVKRMRNVQKANPAVQQTLKNISAMRDIVDKNPEIAGSLAAAFINPNDPGIKSIIASVFTPSKTKEAIQKFQKLAADINLNELASFGQNVSDARQSLVEKTKASANLEKGAIIAILDKLEEQKKPWNFYMQAVREGLNEDFEVYDDPEAFRVENMTDEQLDYWEKKLDKRTKR